METNWVVLKESSSWGRLGKKGKEWEKVLCQLDLWSLWNVLFNWSLCIMSCAGGWGHSMAHKGHCRCIHGSVGDHHAADNYTDKHKMVSNTNKVWGWDAEHSYGLQHMGQARGRAVLWKFRNKYSSLGARGVHWAETEIAFPESSPRLGEGLLSHAILKTLERMGLWARVFKRMMEAQRGYVICTNLEK